MGRREREGRGDGEYGTQYNKQTLKWGPWDAQDISDSNNHTAILSVGVATKSRKPTIREDNQDQGCQWS